MLQDSDGSEILLGPAKSTDKMILIEVLDFLLLTSVRRHNGNLFNSMAAMAVHGACKGGSFERKGRGKCHVYQYDNEITLRKNNSTIQYASAALVNRSVVDGVKGPSLLLCVPFFQYH